MSLIKLAAVLGALASSVSAHGLLTDINIDGKDYAPASPYVERDSIEWYIPGAQDTGFVESLDFASPDIVCHKRSTPGKLTAPALPGSKVDFKWSVWPTSHHGPVIDYLARCPGTSCAGVDKTKLKFFKIDEMGVTDYAANNKPTAWATDKLIANNNTWSIKLPLDIAPGAYVLRHEIIALHSAFDLQTVSDGKRSSMGPQFYPTCVTLDIGGSGTKNPDGVVATSFYNPNDAGLHYHIYIDHPEDPSNPGKSTKYQIPGPPLYTGATSSDSLGGAKLAVGSSSSSAAASSAASSASTPASTSSAAVAGSSSSAAGSISSVSSQASPMSATEKKKHHQHHYRNSTTHVSKMATTSPVAAQTSVQSSVTLTFSPAQSPAAVSSQAAATSQAAVTSQATAPSSVAQSDSQNKQAEPTTPVAVPQNKLEIQPPSTTVTPTPTATPTPVTSDATPTAPVTKGDEETMDDVLSRLTKILRDWISAHGGKHARDLGRQT